MALAIQEVIKLRTRQEGIGTNGKLKDLAQSTQLFRARNSKRLNQDTSPTKSNLTATGQLLDSINGEAQGDKVKISLKGKRKKELGGNKSQLSNDQVGEYVREGGREFLKLSPEEKQEAIDLATQIINEEIKAALK
jgi:hypothetical protein